MLVSTSAAHGDDDPAIAVRATLAPAVPAVGGPDFYSVTIYDATEHIIYDFGANMYDGEDDIIVGF